MLKINNITKSFGGVQAIQGSNFVVKKNKVTALIGPNGAGKTTLFDIICGLVKPDSGEAIFDGMNLSKLQIHKRINLGISRTFQQVRLFKYLTILDHLLMTDNHDDTKILSNILSNKKIAIKKYEKVLVEFGIERSLDTPVSELSYGQRKLLDIAMALRKQHKLLMLDEPVAGVNQVIQNRIENLLLDLKERGETMLIIDHDMEFVHKLADHVIVLDAGVVFVEGNPDVVLQDKRVLEAYLGE